MIKVVGCKFCRMSIVWMRTANGKNIPVDADTVVEGECDFQVIKSRGRTRRVPVFNHEHHRAHFATCNRSMGESSESGH